MSVVNVGVLDHPVSGTTMLAFLARARRKLHNLRRLLRDVFHAAGGNPDLDIYDQVMAEARRCAVLSPPAASGPSHTEANQAP